VFHCSPSVENLPVRELEARATVSLKTGYLFPVVSLISRIISGDGLLRATLKGADVILTLSGTPVKMTFAIDL